MNNNNWEPENQSQTVDFKPGSRFRHIYLPKNVDSYGRSNKVGTVEIQKTQGYIPGGEIYYSVKFNDGTYATSLPQSSMMPPYSSYLPKKKGVKSNGGKSRKMRKNTRRTLRK